MAKKKSSLHPRNRHQGRYDIEALAQSDSDLRPYVRLNPRGEKTIDFGQSDAVIALNKALLTHYYQIKHWTLPAGYLCPPIPGRADYIHYAADLLQDLPMASKLATQDIRVLDIGTGANLVYPILGNRSYGWRFVASDIDPVSVACAGEIVKSNAVLNGKIDIRLQANNQHFFQGIVRSNEYFHLTLCNPPFHKSVSDANKGTQRKLSNLNKNKNLSSQATSATTLNFGGRESELVCPGGELAFITGLMNESKSFKEQVGWFTCLVSKKEHLPRLKKVLSALRAKEVRVVNMSQGQKISRFMAWTF